MFNERKEKLLSQMNANNVDAVLIISNVNISYFTGFYSEPRERLTMYVLWNDGQDFLLLPALDTQKVHKDAVSSIIGYGDHEDPLEKLNQLMASKHFSKVGIEESKWSVERYKSLARIISINSLINIDNEMTQLRKIKSVEEIDKIKKAISITEEAMKFGIELVSTDITEKKLAWEIENKLYDLGAEKLAFAVKVISGKHSSLPHGKPRTEKIQNNSFVLFDMGVSCDNYKSDISRTIVLGKANEEMNVVYNIVKEALELVLDKVKPGVNISELDRIARHYIEERGYGDYFVHRLGHGLGLELHEYPSIHYNQTGVLEEGMVFTVEPGIYIPSLGGVRIEDDVVVTKNGCDILTSVDKSLKLI